MNSTNMKLVSIVLLLHYKRTQQIQLYYRIYRLMNSNKKPTWKMLSFINQHYTELFPETRIINHKFYNRYFWHKEIPAMTTEEFRSHFRVQRKSFSLLASLLQERYYHPNAQGGRPQYPCDFALGIFIWRISNKATCREIAQQFGVPRSAVVNITTTMTNLIITHLGHVMQLPTTEDLWREKAKIYTGYQFNNNRMQYPVGAIDGSHIPIKPPQLEHHPEAYFNRLGYHSVVLMALVDRTGLFMAINVGRPGCLTDATVFDWSEMSKQIPKAMPAEHYIVGDSGFGLDYWLMVPVKETRTLDEKEEFYNTVHASNRNIIERSFGLLKGRFRKLQYIDMNNLAKLAALIKATILIYNFLLIEKDYNNQEWYYDDEEKSDEDPIPADPFTLYFELAEHQQFNEQNSNYTNFIYNNTQRMNMASWGRYIKLARENVINSVWELNSH